MVFGGIQKLTLLDYPEKTACTLFTVGCDFRCPFCQNASFINPGNEIITVSEVLTFLKTRKGLLDGVCISGGEPLLQDDLEVFIDEIKTLGYLIKIDTNGSDPRKLEKLINSGKIDFISMDIKNTPEKYARTIGMPGFDTSKIQESVKLLQSSTIQHEFRTTVVKEFHTEDDLLSIADWISNAKSISDIKSMSDSIPENLINQNKKDPVYYFLQKFIDSDGVKQKGLNSYSDIEMRHFLKKIKTILPFAELRGV